MSRLLLSQSISHLSPFFRNPEGAFQLNDMTTQVFITHLILNSPHVIDEKRCFSIFILKKLFDQCKQTTEQSPTSLLSEVTKMFSLLSELLIQELTPNKGKRLLLRTQVMPPGC